MPKFSLSVRHLLAALALTSICASLIPGWATLHTLRQDASTAARAATGFPVLAHLADVVRLVQVSRGTAAGFLSGKRDARRSLVARQDEAEAAFATLRAALAGDAHEAGRIAQLESLQRRWAQLAPAVRDARMSAAESFAAHTALIDDILYLGKELRADYGLSRLADASSNALIRAVEIELTSLTEALGRARGMGNGLLASGQAGDGPRRRLEAVLDDARAHVRGARFETGLALDADADYRAVLAAPLAAALGSVDEAVGLANGRIVDASVLEYPAERYFAQMTAAIDTVFAAMGQSREAIRDRLERTARRAEAVAATGAVTLIALIVVIAGVAIWFGRVTTGPLRSAAASCSRIAEGDLTARIEIPAACVHEVRQLLTSLRGMNESLRLIVDRVRHGASRVAEGSHEIAAAAGDLSNRSQSQSAAVEQTSATIEQMNANVDQFNRYVADVNERAHHAAGVADDAGRAVAGLVDTMRGIHASSDKIGDIIAVIDGIAFQTNILALNAAVEAARAGDAGRGFAVVATEVRGLAQRSAEAAKEIKGLITDSVERVGQGTAQMEGARETVRVLVEAISELRGMVERISESSGEQRLGLVQIGQAVQALDSDTQHNAAIAEESAAASSSLQGQVDELVETVAAFKLD